MLYYFVFLSLLQQLGAVHAHAKLANIDPTQSDSHYNSTLVQDSSPRILPISSFFRSSLFKRAADNRCGPNAGAVSCPEGVCCSSSVSASLNIQDKRLRTYQGWCGKEKAHCAAPDCLIDFGPGCDANRSPGGPSTADIPRSKNSALMYGGSGIFKCKVRIVK